MDVLVIFVKHDNSFCHFLRNAKSFSVYSQVDLNSALWRKRQCSFRNTCTGFSVQVPLRG